MGDESTTNSAEINSVPVIASDDDMFKYAMDLVRGSAEKTAEPEADTPPDDTGTDDQSAAEEVNDGKAEDAKAEPQVEDKQPEPDKKLEPEAKTDTAKPETKPPYTPEEIEAEIKKFGDLARLDSSRLTAEGKLIQASMQRGLTPKLQEAAELRKERDTLIQRIRAEETARAKIEAEKKYQEDIEKYGEEMANLFKRVRDLETEKEQSAAERERERQAFVAEQQKIAAQQFHYTFVEKSPEYGIPNTPQWEDMVMSRVLAENQARAVNKEPFISVEEGMKMVAETIGLTDAQRLEQLINANPKLQEALKIKFGQEIGKTKPVGATVIKSSSSGGRGKSEVKPTAAPHDELLEKDPAEWAVQQALALASKPNQ
jgi:hypothetical protein